MLELTGDPLSTREVERVAAHDGAVLLGASARRRVTESRRVVERALADGRAHYGINTGFGSLARQRVGAADLRMLQQNLIRSHAAGVGEPLPVPVVRAMLVLLAASLARGQSGVRPEVLDLLCGLLRAGVTPVVPSIGSVGASGDLAPLAHAALVLMGEGEAWVHGARLPGAAALRAAGLEPVALDAKEGLALINGTHLMAGTAALACEAFDRVLDAAVAALAMSIDACRATDAFLDARALDARAQPGPAAIAERVRRLLRGSAIIPSHAHDDPRVQDPYSLRCAPQVLGAALDAARYARAAVELELGAVTDNPLVFADAASIARAGTSAPGAIVSAGNFHGMPVALPMDVLAIALAHVAGISERRTYFLLSGADPEMHLRPFLTPRPGLQSGYMIAQYTAAACCNELAGLAHPATVTNVPTCAGMEDYNSFGPRSGAKLLRALELARYVVAVELVCGAEALEAHRPLRSGDGVERIHAVIRGAVAPLGADRPPSPDIAAIATLLERGAFRAEQDGLPVGRPGGAEGRRGRAARSGGG